MVSVIQQSILPLLMYLLLQIPVFFCGMLLITQTERRSLSVKTALKSYIAGQMILWAVLQIMAAVMIQCRVRFDILFYCYLVVSAVLAIAGFRRYWTINNRQRASFKKWFSSLPPLAVVLFIIVVALIMLRVITYYLGQHIDQDDARWLAEANDALTYGDMMTRDVSTGEYMGGFVTSKDVASPWPMFYAVVAKLLHVNAATVAHTIYAPVALLLSYSVYALIACELFQKAEGRLTFMLSVAIIHLFYAGTTHTQSVFTMVRIWQGKATVAGISIPLLICLAICINKRNESSDWWLMAATGCATCLMSGMGISMSAILIGGFGLYNIIVYRNWKRVPLWLISLAPAIGSALLFFYLKGVI